MLGPFRNASTSLNSTFTRRTNGHWLGTFRVGKISVIPLSIRSVAQYPSTSLLFCFPCFELQSFKLIPPYLERHLTSHLKFPQDVSSIFSRTLFNFITSSFVSREIVRLRASRIWKRKKGRSSEYKRYLQYDCRHKSEKSFISYYILLSCLKLIQICMCQNSLYYLFVSKRLKWRYIVSHVHFNFIFVRLNVTHSWTHSDTLTYYVA